MQENLNYIVRILSINNFLQIVLIPKAELIIVIWLDQIRGQGVSQVKIDACKEKSSQRCLQSVSYWTGKMMY